MSSPSRSPSPVSLAAVTDPGSFRGFPPAALEFYRRLAADNSKTFWADQRSVYDEAVRGPLEALAAEVEDRYGEFRIFRPNRDVRFSKDKRPYKEQQGGYAQSPGGAAYYVAIDAEGLFVGAGYYQMARDQLARFREAVAADTTGPELEQIVAGYGADIEIGGRELSTAPRGYPRDHPRLRLLQHRGLTIARHFGAPAWLSTRAAKARIEAFWATAEPLNGWLDRNVGPSEEPQSQEGRR